MVLLYRLDERDHSLTVSNFGMPAPIRQGHTAEQNQQKGARMTRQAKSIYEGKTWEEKTYNEIEGGSKLTHVSVTNAFHGDIEGEGTLQYVMMYREDGSGIFLGLERVVGRIGDHSGSFVLQHSGTFGGTSIKAIWQVAPGSGTGDLRGLRGEGGFVAEYGTHQIPITLDYDFE
jgi:hypothetical protein